MNQLDDQALSQLPMEMQHDILVSCPFVRHPAHRHCLEWNERKSQTSSASNEQHASGKSFPTLISARYSFLCRKAMTSQIIKCRNCSNRIPSRKNFSPWTKRWNGKNSVMPVFEFPLSYSSIQMFHWNPMLGSMPVNWRPIPTHNTFWSNRIRLQRTQFARQPHRRRRLHSVIVYPVTSLPILWWSATLSMVWLKGKVSLPKRNQSQLPMFAKHRPLLKNRNPWPSTLLKCFRSRQNDSKARRTTKSVEH